MPPGPTRLAAPAAAALLALSLTAPRPQTALATIAAAGTGSEPTAPVVAAVSLLAWAGAGWLALTVAVVLLSRVPGLVGRTCRALARGVAPVAVRRAVEASLGLTVAVGALAPTAVLAAPVASPAATTSAVGSGDGAWDLDWPSSTAAPLPTADRPGPAGASPSTTTRSAPPAGRSPDAAPPSVAPLRPRSPVPPPAGTAPVGQRPAAARPPAPEPAGVLRPTPVEPAASAVVVRAGDSLWSLAEASLRTAGTPAPTDRQVAQAWPRWWAANRDAVGDDPDLLLPGTVLHPPTGDAGRP